MNALLDSDAALREEFAAMSDLLPALHSAVPDQWREEEPSPDLRQTVRQIPEDADITHADATFRAAAEVRHGPDRRRGQLVAGAAACVAVGVGLTLGVQYIASAPPQGPPGTYGAVGAVSFRDQLAGVEIDGSLIAHTWGTETVLEIEGLQAGASFTVILIAEGGEQFESGTFFGSDVAIDCRMNAAVMRDDVERLEIRDTDGGIVTAAELPDAIDPEQ